MRPCDEEPLNWPHSPGESIVREHHRHQTHQARPDADARTFMTRAKTPIGFEVKQLRERPDEQAPDGSEIRLLPELWGGGLCHCTLPSGRTSKAVKHKTVEEIWYFVQGIGEVWRKLG